MTTASMEIRDISAWKSAQKSVKIADVKPALLKHILAQIDGDRTRQSVYTLLQSIFMAIMHLTVQAVKCEEQYGR